MYSASESTDDLLGAAIAGRYRIISRLGAGGMGVAYRAWDEHDSVPVVIKIPKRIFLADSKFLERFHREIRLLQGLQHPHIVPIVDVGDHEGLPFVVMRFLPGGSLSNRRLRDDQGKPRPNSPAMLHLWLPAVAEALDYVHSQGVVHRDVKPGNIFFDAFWGAYLGDFGIAKIVEESDSFDKEHTLTATHVGIGTQEYMAPEQFTPKAVIDGRADQYALAVMVYEMLAGGRPFTGATAHLIVEVTTFPVPPLPVRRSDVSPLLVNAVHKGLAKRPQERFATCGEFAAAVLRDVPMMRDEPGVARLLCPQCSNILKLPTTAADQKGKCPRCQTQMKVAADLGSLWLLAEARKQRKSKGEGGQENPVTPSNEIDEKASETFKPVSSETPIGRGRTTRLPPPPVLAGGAAVAIALLVLVIAVFGGIGESPNRYPEQLAEALKTLELDPRNRDANEFLARHYCFRKRDWKNGLSYLIKSGMPDAAALANEEIAAIEANPRWPGQFIRIARKWWDYGGRKDLNTPESTAAIREHAVAVYQDQVGLVKEEADIVFAHEWLDDDGDFRKLVDNRRPMPLQSLGEDSDNRELQQKQTRQFAANRSAAEWVLQQGGSVEIELADKSRKRVTALEELRRLQPVGEGEVVKAEQRLRWQNKENVNSRLVYHAKEQVWREEDSMGNYVFSFTERARNPECVELFDASRKVVLRVCASKVIYSEEAGNTFELWRGSWVDYRTDTQPYCVVGIELTAKSGVTDQGLACVAQLTQLEWLGAGGTQVTDAMFEHLRSLTNLRGIGVNWTRVSGHGLATLEDAQLKHLEISGMKDPEVAVAYLHKKGIAEWINFDGMKMSSECVRLLGEMKTLKALHFRMGLITPEQLESLRRQLPACSIHIWK